MKLKIISSGQCDGSGRKAHIINGFRCEILNDSVAQGMHKGKLRRP